MRRSDAEVHRWPRRCKILEWGGEGIRTTSGGVLVRENLPWELMHVPQTECWIPGVVSFAVVTASAVVVHNNLWRRDAVGNETEGGVC